MLSDSRGVSIICILFLDFARFVIWSFHVVALQRTAKKCTKNYNARAQPLSCSLNLLFSDLSVAVVVFLNSKMVSCDRETSSWFSSPKKS